MIHRRRFLETPNLEIIALQTCNNHLAVHRITGMHPVFQQQLLANAVHYLTNAKAGPCGQPPRTDGH